MFQFLTTKRGSAYFITLHTPAGRKVRVQITRGQLIDVYDNMGRTLDAERDCINGSEYGERSRHPLAERV